MNNKVMSLQLTYKEWEVALEEMYFLELRLLEEEYKMKQLCIHQKMDT